MRKFYVLKDSKQGVILSLGAEKPQAIGFVWRILTQCGFEVDREQVKELLTNDTVALPESVLTIEQHTGWR